MWSFVDCLSPSKGPGLCSGVVVLEVPTVKRGWELTVTTPGETLDLVGGGEAVGRRGEKRERERETINMCKQLYNEVPLIGLIKFQVINGWHC